MPSKQKAFEISGSLERLRDLLARPPKTLKRRLEQFQANRGTEGEDPINQFSQYCTPSYVTRYLSAILEQNDLAVYGDKLMSKNKLMIKARAKKEAANQLDDNEVLLPSGETVPIKEIDIE